MGKVLGFAMLFASLAIVEQKLPNGMQVIAVLRPDTPYAVASLWVRSGSADDPPTKEGTAHLLEHLLPLSPYGNATVQIRMENMGALLVPETGQNFMAFSLHAEPSLLLRAFPLLVKMATELRVDVAMVEREKELMRLEMLALHEDPLWAMKTLLKARLFEGTAHAHPPVGWLDTLAQLTLDDARQFHRQHFRALNMALIAVVPDRATLDALTDIASQFSATSVDAAPTATMVHRPLPIDTLLPFLVRPLRHPSEAFWGIGWRVEMSASEKVTMDALMLHLRQTIAPAIFGRVGTVREWALVANPVRGAVAITLVARLRPTTDLPERLWRQALQQLAEQGLEEAKMEQLRRQLLLHHERSTADPLQCAKQLGWAWALNDEPELVSRYEQMVASLDGEQIRRLAQRLTKTDPISVTVKH